MKDSKAELKRIVSEYMHDYPRFRKELKKLLKKGVANDDIYIIGAVSYYLALVNYREGHRTSFLSNAYRAATVLEKTTAYDLLARSYNLLGIAYNAQENYQLALASYNRALQIVREHRQCTLRKSTPLNNIAECYSKMGEYHRSIRITEDCLKKLRKKHPEVHSEAVIYAINLSEYYENTGESLKGKAILDSVDADAAVIDRDSILCGYWSRRSCIAYSLGDVETANRYNELILRGVADGIESYELSSDFERIANYAIAAGDYELAGRFGQILEDYAKTSGHTLDKITATRVKAEYFKAIGDKERLLELLSDLNELYMRRMKEEKAMQFAVQKKVEETNRDIKKLMKRIRVSEETAERDPLTRLLNRSALVRVTSEFITAAKAKRKKLGGIFIDIDFFKEYNDTYGHAMGDEAIKKVAEACLAEETPTVRFARYGGDEFFGITVGHSEADITKIARAICSRLRDCRTEHIKNPCGQRLTVSIGVVNVDMKDGDNTIIDLVNCADKALYHAKSIGKDCIVGIDRSGLADAEYTKIEY